MEKNRENPYLFRSAFHPIYYGFVKAKLVERKEDSDTSTLKPRKKQRIFVVFVVCRWEDFNGSIYPIGDYPVNQETSGKIHFRSERMSSWWLNQPI